MTTCKICIAYIRRKKMEKYEIDENTAKVAKEINSFDDYKSNSATSEYESLLNNFNNEIDRLIKLYPQNINDETLKLIEYYKDKYSKKLAFAINKSNSIEARMPSILISGAGNFNTRKKEKQNNARESFWKEYGNLFEQDNYYFNKIKLVNAYYKKHKTLTDCELLTTQEIKSLNEVMTRFSYYGQPYPSFELTNN